ncbi:hypothetical protein E4T39_04635 [Aureobasidium subglaciale]|nr:hypothetical protein E4T39_04635 [Aureobasidium subglaciale]
MATLIDWNLFNSDGIAIQNNTPTPPSYLVNLARLVNLDLDIQRTFGTVSFNSLPTNYTLQTRPGDNHYLYGHPSGRNFNSAKKAAVHIISLLRNRLQTCTCVLCNNIAPVIPQAQAPIIPQAQAPVIPPAQTPIIPPAQPPINPTMASSAPMDVDTGVDDDGTPNIFEELLFKAKQGERISQAITEPKSLDWLLERESAGLPAYLESLKTSGRFVPRLGEIVLIARNLEGDQRIVPDGDVFKILEPEVGYVGFPVWEAAVVTQVDKRIVTVGLLEGVKAPRFRVEPMSEIGNPSKAWSTRYEQISVVNVRPFRFWQQILGEADTNNPNELHPTVRHALTAMSSLSVVDRFYFESHGQEVRIYCKGLYVGAEFIVPGDIVQFSLPGHDDSAGLDVVHIEQIYISVRLDREPHPESLHVMGRTYTTDANHSFGQYDRPIPMEELPFPPMAGFGLWYMMQAKDDMTYIPATLLLARLFEDGWFKAIVGTASYSKVAKNGGAHHLGLPNDIINMLYGIKGVLPAREFSSKYDARMKAEDEGKGWYIAEDRVEQLDLSLVNGQDVGDKARFGFEDPDILQEYHLQSMFRAYNYRKQGSKGNYNHAAPAQGKQPMTFGMAASGMTSLEDHVSDGPFDQEQADLNHVKRAMDKFEQEFTTRDEQDRNKSNPWLDTHPEDKARVEKENKDRIERELNEELYKLMDMENELKDMR